MTEGEYRRRYEAGHAHRRDGSHEAAGTAFSRAAHGLLGGSELGGRDGLLLAAVTMSEAAICYRIGGHAERCGIRCRQGESVVDELDALYYEAAPLAALADELRGDLRLITGRKGHGKHHRQARAVYAEYEDDSERWGSTDEFELAFDPFLKAAAAVGHDCGHYRPAENPSLLSRAFEKKYHFEEVLGSLDGVDAWTW